MQSGAFLSHGDAAGNLKVFSNRTFILFYKVAKINEAEQNNPIEHRRLLKLAAELGLNANDLNNLSNTLSSSSDKNNRGSSGKLFKKGLSDYTDAEIQGILNPYSVDNLWVRGADDGDPITISSPPEEREKVFANNRGGDGGEEDGDGSESNTNFPTLERRLSAFHPRADSEAYRDYVLLWEDTKLDLGLEVRDDDDSKDVDDANLFSRHASPTHADSRSKKSSSTSYHKTHNNYLPKHHFEFDILINETQFVHRLQEAFAEKNQGHPEERAKDRYGYMPVEYNAAQCRRLWHLFFNSENKPLFHSEAFNNRLRICQDMGRILDSWLMLEATGHIQQPGIGANKNDVNDINSNNNIPLLYNPDPFEINMPKTTEAFEYLSMAEPIIGTSNMLPSNIQDMLQTKEQLDKKKRHKPFESMKPCVVGSGTGRFKTGTQDRDHRRGRLNRQNTAAWNEAQDEMSKIGDRFQNYGTSTLKFLFSSF